MTSAEVQFYNRQGEAITHGEAYDMIAQNLDHVARTNITDAADLRKCYIVSTIWMGVDIELGEYPQPMIFQTAVFDRNHNRVADIGSATEEHAMQAHKTMVEEYTKKMVDAVVDHLEMGN